jgi:hypothetical protein
MRAAANRGMGAVAYGNALACLAAAPPQHSFRPSLTSGGPGHNARPGMQLSADDIAELTRLEEAMWIAATRFDAAFQQEHFAPDVFEIGQSGRVYTRAQMISTAGGAINAGLPLDGLRIRHLDGATVQVTYNSHVAYGSTVEHARRSSIWTRTEGGWVMRFHQGTPYDP